jgi:NADPH:quinone reductase-like Zn-dependent oxidoreductase
MSTPKQKALFLTEAKGKFTVGITEIPKPGPGEILAEIQATALNPLDWKVQAFGVVYDTFPAILGSDAASIVKEVGEGVKNVSVGDKM